MHEVNNASKELPTNPTVRYEGADQNTKFLTISIVILLVLVVSSVVAVAGLYSALETNFLATDPTPLPLLELRATPPPPRLIPYLDNEVTPSEALRVLEAQEEELLSSYEWIDRPSGVVRIPIERAMEVIAEEGPEALEAQSE